MKQHLQSVSDVVFLEKFLIERSLLSNHRLGSRKKKLTFSFAAKTPRLRSMMAMDLWK